MITLSQRQGMESVVTVDDKKPNESCEIDQLCNEVEVLVVSESASDTSSVKSNMFFLPSSAMPLSDYETISSAIGDYPSTNDDDPTANHHDPTANDHDPAANVVPDDVRNSDEEEFRLLIRDTCEQLLIKLETVRLSVLHLQYSLHAGAAQSTALQAEERSHNIWNWNSVGPSATTPVKGLHFPSDVFSVNITSELEVPGDIYDVYDFGSNNDASNFDIKPDDPLHTAAGDL
jgi:hypothetical protein